MKLRQLKREDIISCSKIVEQNYSEKYANNSILEMNEMFSNSVIKPKYIVAEENDEILGFGGYIQSFMDYQVYQIFWINVKPDFQRRSIGTKIVKKIIDEIKDICGEDKKARIIQLTTTKEDFYDKKFNFIKVADLGEDEYLMILKL